VAGPWTRLGIVLLAVGLAAGCGGDRRDVGEAEELLAEGYLEPLDEAGLPASVADACRYDGPVTDPLWHLSVTLRLAGPPERVADVLERAEMVVLRDRTPMIVQQVRDAPRDGWNGVLSASDGGSELGLVYNNAARADWDGTVGWAEVCPTPER
jgi:hypothetical protein